MGVPAAMREAARSNCYRSPRGTRPAYKAGTSFSLKSRAAVANPAPPPAAWVEAFRDALQQFLAGVDTGVAEGGVLCATRGDVSGDTRGVESAWRTAASCFSTCAGGGSPPRGKQSEVFRGVQLTKAEAARLKWRLGEVLRSAFVVFDVDGDGSIHPQELMHVMALLGEPLSWHEVVRHLLSSVICSALFSSCLHHSSSAQPAQPAQPAQRAGRQPERALRRRDGVLRQG